MNAFIAILRHELWQWHLAAVGAAILGVMALASPILPHLDAYQPHEVRMTVALALAVLFGSALTLFLGANLLNREASDRRLAFYFVRPVPGLTLWLAKLTARMLLLVAVLLLVFLPTLLVHPEQVAGLELPSRAGPLSAPHEAVFTQYLERRGPADGLGLLGLVGLAVLVLTTILILDHFLVTILSSRGPWLILDFVGAALVALIGFAAFDHLITWHAMGPLLRVERFALVGLALAFIVAGALQVSQGRSDFERGRRFLSASLWGLLIVFAAGVWGFAQKATSVEASDLVARRSVSLPGGEWIAVAGPTRSADGYQAAFLEQVDGERSIELGPVAPAWEWLTTSPDGRIAAWPSCRRLAWRECEVWTVDLSRPEAEPRMTEIPFRFATLNDRLVVSPDGRRIAHLRGASPESVAFYDLKTSRQLMVVQRPWIHAVHELGDGRARLFAAESVDGEIEILEVDVTAKSVRRTGTLPSPKGAVHLISNPVTDMLVELAPLARRLSFRDPVTGEALTTYEVLAHPMELRFLDDGRSLLIRWSLKTKQLVFEVFDERGEPLQETLLDGVASRRLGGEIRPGRYLVGLISEEDAVPDVPLLDVPGVEPASSWVLYELDADTLALEPLVRGLVPFPTRPNAVDSASARLLMAGDGAVIAWDDGEARAVLESLPEVH